MNMYDLITKKKQRQALSEAEISEFVTEYTAGRIPDYQVSALLMAICLCGMNDEETKALTLAIAGSGNTVDLSEFGDLSVDKHSTGGVGDKTTLIVAPIAAALGCKVAKMSGRGLGHTGGTVDKLESFPGYRTELSAEEFFEQVRRIGISVVGQSGGLAPADKKLYALRDVTATVDSIPLITSSIMGKKLASGSHSIVLDVKCGSGSFMKTEEDAYTLAKNMTDIGKMAGRNVTAIITDMDIPLGHAIGNSLEVIEAIEVLSGGGPEDLKNVCIALATEMVSLSLGYSEEESRAAVIRAIDGGEARKKLAEWIEAQGGDARYVEDTSLFAVADFSRDLISDTEGYISHIDTEAVGLSSVLLGAGRIKKDDLIDHSAGIILHKKTGERVSVGDKIATLYSCREAAFREAVALLRSAYSISDTPAVPRETVRRIIR